MSVKSFDSFKFTKRSGLRVFYLVFALFFTANAQADYFIFAGGHIGYTYYDEINDEINDHKLEDGQVGNNGLDVLAAWGNKDYGVGLTFTTGQHLIKTDQEGIRLHQKYSGPGLIFSTIYKNPQDAKTMSFIGVESLTLTTSLTKCGNNQAVCDQLEKDLDGSTAQAIVLGIIDTATSGLAIGLTGRVYQSDTLNRGYDLNLLIGIGF